jgi:hypothetical protein
VTDEAKAYFLEKGFDARFGARPLRQRLLKDLDAPLADLISSGGIPAGSRVLVVATGVDKYGKALEFYYEPEPDLLRQAEKLRAAEVGRSGGRDKDSVPSISLDTNHGLSAESAVSSSAGTGGGSGPQRTPKPSTRRSSRRKDDE